MIPKEILNATTERSLVSLVNSVGVDVTACMEHPQWAAALQFVCGLGPRKAAYIIRVSDFLCVYNALNHSHHVMVHVVGRYKK